MNAERLKQLRTTYLETLRTNTQANPQAYPWLSPMKVIGNDGNVVFRAKTCEEMTDRIIASVEANSFTLDANSAPTLNESVRLLGITPTKRALLEWLA